MSQKHHQHGNKTNLSKYVRGQCWVALAAIVKPSGSVSINGRVKFIFSTRYTELSTLSAKIGQPQYFDKLTEKCKILPPGRI